MVYDISPVIHDGLAVFPGDTPFKSEFLMQTALGDFLTLSKFSGSVHLGAHADAPNHYAKDHESIADRSLDYYLGPAQVIRLQLPRGERVTKNHLENIKINAPRVLFSTGSFPNPDIWNNDFCSLSAEVIDWLHSQKVILVGIDTPSIDLADDKILQSHMAVHKNNMAILEGLILTQVPEGTYELIALPLKIKGSDASPVRAILRSL
jgi:arylformamidase